MNTRFARRSFVTALLVVFAAAALPSAASAAPTAGQSWKFAITDDSRASGPSSWKKNGVAATVLGVIASDIATQGVDFVLFPGDMVTGETDTVSTLSSMLDTWKDTMKPVSDAKIPVYVTRGNHEYNPCGANVSPCYGFANPNDPSRDTFLAHFTNPGTITNPGTSYQNPGNGPKGEEGLTWSFTHNNVKVVGFDQYANRTASFDNRLYAPGSNKGQMMNAWVIDEIKHSSAPLNFVIAHEQIWPSDSHPDCLANDPDSRDALAAVLATHNGSYLAGHDHMYVRGLVQKNNGIRTPAFVVGTAGGGNYNHNFFDVFAKGYPGPYGFVGEKSISNSASPTFGYLLVTVNPDNTWTAEFRGFTTTASQWATGSPVPTTSDITVLDSFSSSDLLNWP